MTVSPTSGLADGQQVTVGVKGVPPGATLLALQCSLRALHLSEDACENHRNALFFAKANGRASTTLTVTSNISTAVGKLSCQSTTCLVGVVRFTSGTSEQILGFAAVHFATSSCQGGDRCLWAPPDPLTTWRPTTASPPASHRLPGDVAPGSPVSLRITASASGALLSRRVTGPFVLAPGRRRLPPHPESGEGVLQLSLVAPGTSWASARDKAVVIEARVDGGPWQQIVVFGGSSPFTYAGFTGPLTSGIHRLRVRVEPSVSTTGEREPKARLLRARLSVVTASNPGYLLERYAPVVYGRTDSASSDTELLTYANASPLGGGSTQLTYETVWTHEDAGTSFVPYLEWGEWGRMTDITETVSLDVAADGTISHPMYDWCGCGRHFPENRQSLQEVMVPFHGSYADGTHMIVRNASGNDYQNHAGTTAFRFQQVAVAGPKPGEAREAVMDAHPWTYRFMNQEVRWWYLDRSTNPLSPQPGTAGQYAIVDLDTTGTALSAVGVELRLAGSSRFYANDFHHALPLYDGGHGRTVVKLPLSWQHQAVTGARLMVTPSSATSSLDVVSFEVLAVTPSGTVRRVPTPPPKVVRA